MGVELTIPDEVLVAGGLTERDCLIELAVQLYSKGRIPLDVAVRLSQIDESEFQTELGQRVSGRMPSAK